MRIKDVMTKNPITVESDTLVLDAQKIMKENNIRRLPVVDKGKLKGIITKHDLLEASPSPATSVETEHGDLFVAGGVESMTRGPLVMAKGSDSFQRGNVTAYDSSLGWRFPNLRMGELYSLSNNGETAENVAEKYQISRKDQDELALGSHQKAVQAQQQGRLKDEIVPVEIPQRKGAPLVHDKDEGRRADTSLEKLAALTPSFRKGGSVTAGNSSPLSDGAAALLVTSPQKAEQLGLVAML